jgi:hypothetical protein
MTISSKEQTLILKIIDKEERWKLESLGTSAYCELENLSCTMGLRPLNTEENKRYQYNIELITRLDDKMESGGLWFRIRRRAALTAYYSSADRSMEIRAYRTTV